MSLKMIFEMQRAELSDKGSSMKLVGLSPYWFDTAEGNAVHNTVDMQSLFILTGPNGGGKSSLLRSICAAALLGICGFMVPAESASIPHFDSIMLHLKSYDSPADGKSSFQVLTCLVVPRLTVCGVRVSSYDFTLNQSCLIIPIGCTSYFWAA